MMPNGEEHFEKQKNFEKLANDFFDSIEKNTYDEKKFLESLKNCDLSGKDTPAITEKVIEVLKTKMKNTDDLKLVHNAQKLTNLLNKIHRPADKVTEVYFFPSLENEQKLANFIDQANSEILLCVFIISNDHLASSILNAYDQGVKVRIITDDYWVTQKGSDVIDLAAEGIEVRTDNSKQDYMHNKYLVIDRRFVVTGSYNWTTHASTSNQENLVVLENESLVKMFSDHFEEMWIDFAKNQVKTSKKTKKTELYAKAQKYLKKKAEHLKDKIEEVKTSLSEDQDHDHAEIIISEKITKVNTSSHLLKPSKKIHKPERHIIETVSRVAGDKPHLRRAAEIAMKIAMVVLVVGLILALKYTVN